MYQGVANIVVRLKMDTIFSLCLSKGISSIVCWFRSRPITLFSLLVQHAAIHSKKAMNEDSVWLAVDYQCRLGVWLEC